MTSSIEAGDASEATHRTIQEDQSMASSDVPVPPPSFPPPPPPAPQTSTTGAPAPMGTNVPVPSASERSTVQAPPLVAEMLEEVPFHRLNLARGRRPRWWRPLLTALLGIVLYIAMIVLAIIPFGIAAVLDPQAMAPFLSMAETGQVDLNDPVVFTITMVSIILMLPAVLIASRVVAGRGVGLLSSVTGRLRGGWMLRCLAAGVGVFVLGIGLSTAVSWMRGDLGPAAGTAASPWPMLLLALLLVPLQCAAEEYVFRGFLMQTIGSWLRHPAFAILLPLPLFVFGHIYDVWGLLSVGVFALAAGWLTWRTGGLEAAIALHVVNNLSVFVMAAFGLADANASGGGPVDLLASVLMIGASVLVIEWMLRRAPITRTLRWPAPAPSVP